MPIYWTCDDIERDRDECADLQDKADRELHAELSTRTPAELDAEAMKAREDAEDLKHLPIGITIEQAKRKGWIA